MIIKNRALIEFFGTNELTEDMEIVQLELSLDQDYDFDEVRAIQEMFNIQYINIKEIPSYPFDDFGIDDDEDFDPFEQNEDKTEKVLRFISELSPNNVKNLAFFWDKDGKEFDTKILRKFNELEKVTAVDDREEKKFELSPKQDIIHLKSPALIKYFGTDELATNMDITSIELALDLEYDFEEVRLIQEKFNITNIEIKEHTYEVEDDFGIDEDEYFDPFEEKEKDSRTIEEKVLSFTNELNSKNIKNISLLLEKNNFDVETIRGFDDLETITQIDDYGKKKLDDFYKGTHVLKLKNPALIKYFRTDMLIKDMGISSLELSLNEEYDFDEIHKLQDFFNIESVSIKENERDLDRKSLSLIKKLNPKNIKNLTFYWYNHEFDISTLEEFKDLESVSGINFMGAKSFEILKKQNKATIFTGNLDIISFTTSLDSTNIDFQDISKAKRISISKGQNLDEVLEKASVSIQNLEEIDFTGEISLDEINKLSQKNIRATSSDDLVLRINNVSELSPEMLEDLRNNQNIPIQKIKIYSETNDFHQNEPYDINEYIAIYNELTDLVKGIDDNLSEKEKFAEIYKRVATSITYDSPAAYPETPDEEQYSGDMFIDCRNLKNALLYKKTVCAGYADVLRNALSLKGIEALYIGGFVKDNIILETIKKTVYPILNKEVDLKGDGHAWNKVKLDGKWYNVDVTWDRNTLLYGLPPLYALKSDKDFEKIGRNNFEGPECPETLNSQELMDIFYGKHLHIGIFTLPNGNEIKNYLINTKNRFAEYFTDIERFANNTFIKAKNIFNKNKTLDEPKDIVTISNANKSPKANSWDLQNWGIDKKNINKQIDENSNTTKQMNEQNRDLENDGRG